MSSSGFICTPRQLVAVVIGRRPGDGRLCNNPPTITPVDAPISFSATARDVCQGPLAAEITAFDCFTLTKKSRRIDKTQSCIVSISGDGITISDSGGVGDMIEWTASATDASGNSTTVTCSLVLMRPGN